MDKRVAFWAFGGTNDASSQYRARLVVDALRSQGCTDTFVFDSRGPDVAWSHKFSTPEPPPTAQVRGVIDPGYDIVVLSRPAKRWWADVIPFFQEKGIRIIVDVDDLFDRIHKNNRAFAGYDPNRDMLNNHQWCDEACKRADLVTCTTPALQKRYGHGHSVVLPNLVPESYLRTEANVRSETIGWTGTVKTHPEDLQATRSAVPIVLDAYGWKFHVVGDGAAVQSCLSLREEPSITGLVEFGDYAAAMAEINVGIVPLADTEFNRAKSCLKMIEFASLGVPVLATATPDNERMAKLGVGRVVTHPSHWRKALKAFVASPELRADVAGRSREVMVKHTYEAQCDRWAFAWGLERSRISATI